MAQKKKKQIHINVDTTCSLFNFINDDGLKQGLDLSFRYIIFLILLEEKHRLPVAINHLVFKNGLIVVGSLIETVLYYTIRLIEQSGTSKQKHFLKTQAIRKDKYENEKEIITANPNIMVFYGLKVTSFSGLKNTIQFKDLIHLAASNEIGILSKFNYGRCDDIRKLRNQIHLHLPQKVFTKKDINKYFNLIQFLINRVEKYIIINHL